MVRRPTVTLGQHPFMIGIGAELTVGRHFFRLPATRFCFRFSINNIGTRLTFEIKGGVETDRAGEEDPARLLVHRCPFALLRLPPFSSGSPIPRSSSSDLRKSALSSSDISVLPRYTLVRTKKCMHNGQRRCQPTLGAVRHSWKRKRLADNRKRLTTRF